MRLEGVLSPFLTPNPEQVEEPEADDGTFWMTYDDWKKNFVSVSVCMAHVPVPDDQPGTVHASNLKRRPKPHEPALWPDVAEALGVAGRVRTAGHRCPAQVVLRWMPGRVIARQSASL